MILLDTNVLSELMKAKPAPRYWNGSMLSLLRIC